jgi:hypothetical protein
MERLFQQQQLVAAAEAMQAAGNLSPDVQHQLMNILAAGTLNSSGAAQFNMKPDYGQHGYGRHHGHAGRVVPGMSMAPHGMIQSAGRPAVSVNPLGMMDMHLPGAMPHAHLPFCPSPSSSSLGTGAESLGCMSEDDSSSKRRGTSDGVFIFTRRRAGQKERSSNEPVALSKKRLQVLPYTRTQTRLLCQNNSQIHAERTPRRTPGPKDAGRRALNSCHPHLQELFDFPLKEAATQLGISMTAMKKACRRMGLERWPYRKVWIPCSSQLFLLSPERRQPSSGSPHDARCRLGFCVEVSILSLAPAMASMP